MLDKNFDQEQEENRLYQIWEDSGAFEPNDDPGKENFAIVIPPPNVTGSLHIGHALNNSLQDIIVRYQRLRGKSVLWQPGMDHAGIATQMVVERQLAKNGEPSRIEMGREAFLERVCRWKDESGGIITTQLRRLGASPAWQREKFTMQAGHMSEAVTEIFVRLYREGLLYRDKRMVNWDTKFQTAISDLEVENIETEGKFYHFAYPLTDGNGIIEIATTRPETMLGDTAIAVHPKDERYQNLIGKTMLLPIADRPIPIIADRHADPEQGSGAVKITPAHDFNDFEVGRRHELPQIDLFDSFGRLKSKALHEGDPALVSIPENLQGLDRFEARTEIVEQMRQLGLLKKIEDKTVMQPVGDRSKTVIEPRLTDQWFIDAKTLAQPAIQAVQTGQTRFFPESWTKTYFNWMNAIQPWCISRQLWWGHQIPAWHGPDGHIFVAHNEKEALAQAKTKLGEACQFVERQKAIDMNFINPEGGYFLYRDEDVLDTWFSSALWPFSTQGWPEETAALKKYYPGSLLVTGFDIIFFWVARMMMMGLHFMQDIPFRDVYVHALVRDAQGQKMSKSKGNVIDPLELIDQYGADSVRFTLAALATQGRDIRLAEDRIKGYRNFRTKLWNVARFCQLHKLSLQASPTINKLELPQNIWLAQQLVKARKKLEQDLEDYRFNDAANHIYHFVWDIYCDWAIELAKPILDDEDPDAKEETKAVLGWALRNILIMLHPFMPFVTENIWLSYGERDINDSRQRDELLITAHWPDDALPKADLLEKASETQYLIQFIGAIRSLRSEIKLPVQAKPVLLIKSPDSPDSHREILRNRDIICRLTGCSSLELTTENIPTEIEQSLHQSVRFGLQAEQKPSDMEKDKKRIQSEIKRLETEIFRLDKKLSNPEFVERAPTKIVQKERDKRENYRREKEGFEALLQ